jgi:hypothetical protein
LALPRDSIKIGIFNRTRPVFEIKKLRASDINDYIQSFPAILPNITEVDILLVR